MHGNSVPVYERDSVPLRREKLASPANAWELCSRVYEETLSPQARKCLDAFSGLVKFTSPREFMGDSSPI